ncbi:MAG: acyl-CoA thioesterase [Planctomycetes bacterium]|nr:acyl-CoA thioesterase [Planctomycetota bacterium]
MEPLAHTIRVTVRFMESDLLRMVWHGNYVRWIEDARQALGSCIGLGYEDFMREHFACPIVDMHLSYKRPARYGDKLDITASLHWMEVPKLVHSYEVRRAADGELLTTAETTQVLLHPDQKLALNFPPFLDDFRQRWKLGQVKVPATPAPTPWS